MTVRSIAEFRAQPGCGDAFEAAYRSGEFLDLAFANPGYHGGELVRSSDDPDRFIVLAEWDAEADYRAWQAAYADLPADASAALLETLAGPPTAVLGPVLQRAARS